MVDGKMKDASDITNVTFFSLGGNHLLHAIQQILHEEPGADDFDCLRTIHTDVYEDITETEGLFLAAWHNNRCQNKELTFQEKVNVARRSYIARESNNWKEHATVTLGYLATKKYTKESLGTVLSVASYGEENWKVVEEIFRGYCGINNSIPQNLFRQLQGVEDLKRLPYLTKSIGTNGLKVASIIASDKRRENLKVMGAQILQQESWEEVETVFVNSDQILSYTGNLSTPEGRCRFATYVKKIAANEEEDVPNVKICISKAGKDITSQYKAILQKYEKKILIELKKSTLEE